VERDREVVLLGNVGRLLDPEPANDVTTNVEAEDVARLRLRVGGIVGELDAAGLAASTREHLCLDDDRAAQLFCSGARLFRGRREASFRHRDAEALEQLFALVLVEVHGRARVYSRAAA